MLTSLRQILANRAKALKSTGPRSPEGKLRSSQNVISHGLTDGNCIVIKGESRECFERLKQCFFERFQPSDPVTALQVEEMAVAKWRLRRLWTIESALYDNELDCIRKELDRTHSFRESEARVGLAYKSLHDKSQCIVHIERHQNRLTRQFERAYAMFHYLEHHHRGPRPENTTRLRDQRGSASDNVIEFRPLPPIRDAA